MLPTLAACDIPVRFEIPVRYGIGVRCDIAERCEIVERGPAGAAAVGLVEVPETIRLLPAC